MITHLVAFGDSWTYGDELVASKDLESYRLSHSFPGLVAQHYDLIVENHGKPGASLQSMIWDFQSWISQGKNLNSSICLFGLTQPMRTSWYNNASGQYEHSIRLFNQPVKNDFYELNKLWATNSACTWLYAKQYETAVYLFAGLCQRFSIPSIQFNIFPNRYPILRNPVIDPDQSMKEKLLSLQETNKQQLMLEHHPNELGHGYIAQYLIEHINQNHLIDR